MTDSLNIPSPSSRTPQPIEIPQHNILITIPRTASNLLTHLLALPSQFSIIPHPRDGYFFLPALAHRVKSSTFTRPYESWSDTERDVFHSVSRKGFEEWEGWVNSAERGSKGTYVKEHVNWMLKPSTESAYLHSIRPTDAPSELTEISAVNEMASNPTVIQDTFWLHVRPTFLIRHPALTFPSALRTAIDNEGFSTVLSDKSEKVQKWECTYHWHMLLYLFITSQRQTKKAEDEDSGGEPIVVDAEDLRDELFVRHYASIVGLDPKKVRNEWTITSQEEQDKMHKVERRMKDTLLGSTGVLNDKLHVGDVNIEEEQRKWQVEFGKVLAERLEGLVRGAMEEYEWLRDKRMRV